MGENIKYIGTFEEKEIDKKSSNKTKKNKEKNKEKNEFKVNKKNIKVSKFISSTKNSILNKKVICFLLIILLIYIVKPITFLRAKLDEKREYYSKINTTQVTTKNLWESIVYTLGIDYYKTCKDTMFYPADGSITCQFDLAHQGIDIACEEYPGNIYAAANGNVVEIGYDEKYGNFILIEHEIKEITLYTYYANLSKINVTNGQYVYQNQIIALEGGSPDRPAQIMDSEGHHLHFEVRKSKKSGSGLNPLIFLN